MRKILKKHLVKKTRKEVERVGELNLTEEIMDRKKERFTTYISGTHLLILRQISEETGRPISALIGEALDEFLKSIGWLTDPVIPPVEKDFYRARGKGKEESA